MAEAADSTAAVGFMVEAGSAAAEDLAAGEHSEVDAGLAAALAEAQILAGAVDLDVRMAAECGAAADGDSADTHRADITGMGQRGLAAGLSTAEAARDSVEVTARDAELAMQGDTPMRERRLPMGDGIPSAEAERVLMGVRSEQAREAGFGIR